MLENSQSYRGRGVNFCMQKTDNLALECHHGKNKGLQRATMQSDHHPGSHSALNADIYSWPLLFVQHRINGSCDTELVCTLSAQS